MVEISSNSIIEIYWHFEAVRCVKYDGKVAQKSNAANQKEIDKQSRMNILKFKKHKTQIFAALIIKINFKWLFEGLAHSNIYSIKFDLNCGLL